MTRYPWLPSREEILQLRDRVKQWDSVLWRDWGRAIENLQNVYTPRETMSEKEARDQLLLIQTKVLVHLVEQGLAKNNSEAIDKTHCIEALIFIEQGRKITETYRFLLQE